MEMFFTAARENVDRFLADAVGDDFDSIHENILTLAFDGAIDAGASDDQARHIASQLVIGN